MTQKTTLLTLIPIITLSALIAGLQAISSFAGASTKVWVESSTIILESIQDNTLYEESDSLSNGQGEHFFAGVTAQGERRRGLLKFDIVDNVPSDAFIVSATLQVHVSKAPNPSVHPRPEQFFLHRLEADWGEGASNALGEEGEGTAAEEGDATWSFSYYSITSTNRISWTTPGGDFLPTTSAATIIGVQDGNYYWRTSAGIIADLNYWLRSPHDNHGWLLMGDESTEATARRFDSRENGISANRPVLYVMYVTTKERNFLPLVASD